LKARNRTDVKETVPNREWPRDVPSEIDEFPVA
jgi:hypothetical protein